MHTETLIRRNFKKSGVIIVAGFILNAGINLFLLGFLARRGGMSLVGLWTLLNTVMLYVLIMDLGFTNALTRHVALEGVIAALPLIVWLIFRLAVLWVILGLGCLAMEFSDVAGYNMILGFFMAATAGCLQVASNWVISLRLGQHEQFWLNVKTILRIVTQTVLIVVLVFVSSLEPSTIFGFGLCLGGAVEAIFTLWLVRMHKSDYAACKTAPSVDWRRLAELGRGFGILKVLQQLQVPLAQSLVGALAGMAALGTFTIARRFPIVLSQSIGEAMRVLLPGLSLLQQQGDRGAILRMLRDGVLIQVLLIGPIYMLFFFIMEDAYILWLGNANQTLVVATRLMMIAIIAGSFVVPYFWALQAFGDARLIAFSTALQLTFVITAGATVLWFTQGLIVAFIVVLVLSAFLNSALVLYWSEQRWNILRESLALIAWWSVGLFLACIASIAWVTEFSLQAATPIQRLPLMIGVIVITCAVALPLLHRKNFFYMQTTLREE